MIAPANPYQREHQTQHSAPRVPANTDATASESSVVARTVGRYPVVVLASAVVVGVALGWLVKRKMQ